MPETKREYAHIRIDDRRILPTAKQCGEAVRIRRNGIDFNRIFAAQYVFSCRRQKKLVHTNNFFSFLLCDKKLMFIFAAQIIWI
jgi:hypothetical protein